MRPVHGLVQLRRYFKVMIARTSRISEHGSELSEDSELGKIEMVDISGFFKGFC